MDCELEEEEPTGRNGKKLSKLAKALLKKKPLFNPDEKSFEEYFDEYYKLDCEDVIGGDLECRFKYREVVPNDFGLDVEEIFASKDTELNQWASLKKALNYRPIQEEVNDVKVYKSKKDQLELKKKILHSCYNQSEEEEEEPEEVALVSKDEKAKKKLKKEEGKAKKEPKVEAEATKKEVEKVKVAGKEAKSKSKGHKKKNKNILESITDERLAAYGIEPKKFHKKLKYGGQEATKRTPDEWTFFFIFNKKAFVVEKTWIF